MENYSKMYRNEDLNYKIDESTINELDESIEKDDPIVFATVKTEQLYLREGATKDSEPVTILKEGKELMVDQPIDPESEWVHVCTEEGLEGYVMKFFISL